MFVYLSVYVSVCMYDCMCHDACGFVWQLATFLGMGNTTHENYFLIPDYGILLSGMGQSTYEST